MFHIYFMLWVRYRFLFSSKYRGDLGFPGISDGKESACNAGDLGSIPGLGKSPAGGNGYPLQSSCLENPTDRGAWRGYSPRGRKELDSTEPLWFPISPHGRERTLACPLYTPGIIKHRLRGWCCFCLSDIMLKGPPPLRGRRPEGITSWDLMLEIVTGGDLEIALTVFFRV